MFSKLIRDKNKLPSFVKDLPNDGQGKVALFDADGTLWTDDVADDFTKYAIDTKLLKHAHLWDEYLKIYATDPVKGCRYLLNLYKDISEKDVLDCVDQWWINTSKRSWITEVMEALYCLADRGYSNWIVTGSPTAVMTPLLKYLPLDKTIGIDFALTPEGIITGDVKGICCSGQGKADKVNSLLDGREVLFSCGNSSMDIPMIELSKKVSWSIYPNEQFLSESQEKNWHITPRPADFVEEEKFV